MQTIVRALLLSLFVSVALCNFNGEWTDDSRFGGSLFVCVDDGDLYGMYSEVGIVVGTVSEDGNTATGNWYEGGERTHGCISGTFEWNLSGSSFTGFWKCSANPDNGVEHTWDESRVSDSNPNTKECARLAQRGPIDGHWFSGTAVSGGASTDICLDDDAEEYFASFFFAENPGYEHGYAAEGGRVGGGVFYGLHGLGVLPGRSLWFQLADGTNANLWWLTLNTPDVRFIDNSDVHGYNGYVLNYGTTEGRCDRFQTLEDQYLDYFGYETFFDEESSSTAAFLAVPLCLVFASLVVFL